MTIHELDSTSRPQGYNDTERQDSSTSLKQDAREVPPRMRSSDPTDVQTLETSIPLPQVCRRSDGS